MPECDVVIVGAGAAGLAAAYECASRGARTHLIESRDRAGGRVRWVTLPGTNETAELGAEFIHGPARETRELLTSAQISAIEERGESWVYDGEKLVLDPSEFGGGNHLLDGADALADDETVDAYLQRRAKGEREREAADNVRYFVEGFDAADATIASVWGIATEWNSGVDSKTGRPAHGYAPLIALMQKRAVDAGAVLHFNSVVASISSESGAVQVETQEQTFHARAVIVSVPVGVLARNSITFSPRLPEWKRHAIEYLPMGDVERIVMAFREPFWERVEAGRYRDASFFRSPNGTFGAYWTQLPRRSRTIVAWAGGPRATRARQRFGETLGDEAVREFGGLFGSERTARDAIECVYSHDWTADPFACGAYSYLRVGGGHAREALGRKVGESLYFAGEACALAGQGGTVNGAIVTGQRAALEALASLGMYSLG